MCQHGVGRLKPLWHIHLGWHITGLVEIAIVIVWVGVGRIGCTSSVCYQVAVLVHVFFCCCISLDPWVLITRIMLAKLTGKLTVLKLLYNDVQHVTLTNAAAPPSPPRPPPTATLLFLLLLIHLLSSSFSCCYPGAATTTANLKQQHTAAAAATATYTIWYYIELAWDSSILLVLLHVHVHLH